MSELVSLWNCNPGNCMVLKLLDKLSAGAFWSLEWEGRGEEGREVWATIYFMLQTVISASFAHPNEKLPICRRIENIICSERHLWVIVRLRKCTKWSTDKCRRTFNLRKSRRSLAIFWEASTFEASQLPNSPKAKVKSSRN